MICRSSWVRTGVAALLGVACSSTVCTAQEDYEYEWTCTEAPRAMPCMDGVPCPREDVSNRFACQSLCEDTAGCFSIVFDSSSNECYLKGEDSASAVQAERCTRTPKASAEDDTSRWDDVDCLLWGAGCSAASPLPWLMAVFFGMWNTAVSQMLVVPIMRFCYFGCGDRTARKMCYALVCPHWLLGLAMPFVLGGFVAWGLAVIIPYGRMIRVSAQLCEMERNQPEEQRSGVQLQDDAMAALEQAANHINSQRGRMSRADIWREVDRLQERLSFLRGEMQEGQTTVVVQAEVVPEDLQGGSGAVQVARPLDVVRAAGRQLSFDPSSHFAVPNTRSGEAPATEALAERTTASTTTVVTQTIGTNNGEPAAQFASEGHPRSTQMGP